jgi:hypothetical protein
MFQTPVVELENPTPRSELGSGFESDTLEFGSRQSIGPVCAEKSRVDCNYQQIWLAEASRSGEFSTNIGGERATKR